MEVLVSGHMTFSKKGCSKLRNEYKDVWTDQDCDFFFLRKLRHKTGSGTNEKRGCMRSILYGVHICMSSLRWETVKECCLCIMIVLSLCDSALCVPCRLTLYGGGESVCLSVCVCACVIRVWRLNSVSGYVSDLIRGLRPAESLAASYWTSEAVAVAICHHGDRFLLWGSNESLPLPSSPPFADSYSPSCFSGVL